ncbi:MAG: PmbA/TldA family metallopeptidase, partial [Casimicrobiaceae bacterium]
MLASLRTAFGQLACAGDFWSLRAVDERADSYAVRKNVAQPPSRTIDTGAMLTVYAGGGCGYAATNDLSREGLQAALDRATAWAQASARASLIDFNTVARLAPRGEYASPDLDRPGRSRRDWYELLGEESRQAGCDPRIVDWEASVETRAAEHLYLTSTGGDVLQRYR